MSRPSKASYLALLLLCSIGSRAAAATEVDTFCATPNFSLAAGYPGGLEASAGVTLGQARVNPTQSCFGLMLDVGANVQAAKAAVGLRTFQRYDWPVAAQVDVFVYQAYPGTSGFPGARCYGLEAGFGVLMTMLRLGAGRCPDEGRPFVLGQFGLFI